MRSKNSPFSRWRHSHSPAIKTTKNKTSDFSYFFWMHLKTSMAHLEYTGLANRCETGPDLVHAQLSYSKILPWLRATRPEEKTADEHLKNGGCLLALAANSLACRKKLKTKQKLHRWVLMREGGGGGTLGKMRGNDFRHPGATILQQYKENKRPPRSTLTPDPSPTKMIRNKGPVEHKAASSVIRYNTKLCLCRGEKQKKKQKTLACLLQKLSSFRCRLCPPLPPKKWNITKTKKP